MLTHSGEQAFACERDDCDRRFKTRHSLSVHLRTHAGDKPFVCEHCGKAFTQKSNLTVHLRTHTGEKPYVCEHCAKSFAGKGCLTKHILQHHSDDKPFKCGFVCPKAYVYKADHDAHILTHTGVKPHECDICHTRFTRKGDLNVHMKTHTREIVYECDVCRRTFRTQYHLTRHRPIHTRYTSMQSHESQEDEPDSNDDSGLISAPSSDDCDSESQGSESEDDDEKQTMIQMLTDPQKVDLINELMESNSAVKEAFLYSKIHRMPFMKVDSHAGTASPRAPTLEEQRKKDDHYIDNDLINLLVQMVEDFEIEKKLPRGSIKLDIRKDEAVVRSDGTSGTFVYVNFYSAGCTTLITCTTGKRLIAEARRLQDVEECRQLLHAVAYGKGKIKTFEYIPCVVQVEEGSKMVYSGITDNPAQRRIDHQRYTYKGGRRNHEIRPVTIQLTGPLPHALAKDLEKYLWDHLPSARNMCKTFERLCSKPIPASQIKTFEFGKKYEECKKRRFSEKYKRVRFFTNVVDARRFADLGAPDEREWNEKKGKDWLASERKRKRKAKLLAAGAAASGPPVKKRASATVSVNNQPEDHENGDEEGEDPITDPSIEVVEEDAESILNSFYS